MLFTIAAMLVVLWLFGLVTSHTMGGFIHILLVIAIITILFRIISGRKVALTNERIVFLAYRLMLESGGHHSARPKFFTDCQR